MHLPAKANSLTVQTFMANKSLSDSDSDSDKNTCTVIAQFLMGGPDSLGRQSREKGGKGFSKPNV